MLTPSQELKALLILSLMEQKVRKVAADMQELKDTIEDFKLELNLYQTLAGGPKC